jgi:hypothetical protein
MECGRYICKRDCAHILFLDYNPSLDDEKQATYFNYRVSILIELVRFQGENYAIEQKKVLCQSPGCLGVYDPRTLRQESEEDSLHSRYGMNILMCSCGVSRCLGCMEFSHVGVSCDTYLMVQRNWKRLDEEIRR